MIFLNQNLTMHSSLRQAFYALGMVFLVQGTYAQTDLLPTAITSPTNGCLLSASENVEVRVARGDNTSPTPVSFTVTVTTTVNGTSYPSETSGVSLVPYQAAFISGSSAPIDFSAPGIYNIQCVISYGGTVTANDTITTSVISSVLPGSLSADQTVCEGDNGQITLTGNSGEIVQWEESVDGGINWSALGNTTNSLNYTNIAQTTSYRVLSQGDFDTLILAGGDILGFEAGQQSGWAVALDNSGTRLAIGEFETNGGEGSVRVFDYNGATWTQVGDTLRGSAINRQFGFNVALSDDGNTLAVGIQRSDSIGTDVGAAAIYSWDGSNWSEINMVFGSLQDSLFGRYMDLSDNGQFLVVGSPHNEVNGPNAGAVYSYSYQTDVPVWVQLGLDIDGEAAFDNSGWSVCLSADGSRVAIGATGNDGVGADAGHVRVYEWDGVSWVQLGLDIDGEAAFDNSGWSVSLSADGSRLAIGATGNDGVGADAGHVRVYEWDGISWVQLGLDIDGEAVGDYSGVSVDLSSDGSRIAIGAEQNDAGGAFVGHVRIYQWDGVGWIQLGQDLDGEGTGDSFGFSVSFSSDGDRLAIGAPQNDGGASDAGHVRVYDWDSVLLTWEQLGLDIDGEAPGDGLGNSVSLSSDGNRLAIGATGSNGAGGFTGDVRVYDWDSVSLSWVQLGLAIDGEGANDFSGSSLSLSSDGNRLAIGAILNDGNGPDAGHVRLYDWDGTSLSWVQLGLDIDGEDAGDLSGNSISLSSDGRRLAIGAYGNVSNGPGAGHVRVYELDSFTGFLTLNDTLYGNPGDHFGGSVAIDADGNRLAVGSPKWTDGVQDSLGKVDFYDRSVGVWNATGASVTSDRGSSEFGSDIALNAQGDRLVVGAYLDDLGGVNTGATMVYQRNGGGNWTQIGSDLRGEDFGDGAGIAVGIDNTGDRIVVGAPFNPGGGIFSGHMRMYELLGNNWVQVTPDLDGDAPNDFFGFGVAISGNGNFVTSGSGSNDNAGPDAGLTRVYEVITLPSACGSAYSDTTTITVDAAVIAGTLSGDATVCGSGNSGNISLTGTLGTIQDWEFSIDGGTTWSSLANNTASYTYNNVTATSEVRVIVSNGTCGNDTSNVVTITVDPPVVGGTLSGSATVCQGSNSGNIVLSGETGIIIGWETSTDDGITWTNIANLTNIQSYNNLAVTTWYRAEVQSGTCGNAYSDIAVLTVDPSVLAGTLSGDATVCASSNSGNIALTGTQGNIDDWESSTDGGITWSSLGNTSASYIYNNLTATTAYRVIVSNGTCGNDTSNSVTITVDPSVVGGTLSGAATVCAGSNAGSITLSGETGAIIGWETSTDDGLTWTNLANLTNIQSYTDLTTTTWYRAEVESGTCGNDYSDIAVITVDAITNAGLLSGDSTVCYSSNTGTLTLSGTVGTTVAWESNDGSGWTAEANAGTTYTYSGLLDTTQYRYIATNGACGNDTSNVVTINVDPNLPPDAGIVVVNNTLSSDTTVCAGSNTDTLRLINMVGSVIHWEQSQDGGNTWLTVSNTDTFQVFLDLSTTTFYRALVQGGACGIGYSDTAIVRVDDVSEGGLLAEDMVVCAGSNTDTLVLSGFVGDIVSWEIDSGLGYQPMGVVGDSLIFSDLDTTTAYRVEVKNGVCPAVYSNDVTVSVTPTTVGGTLITATSTVCEGDNSGTILLTNYVGNITRWEYSEDSGATWIPMIETTESITYLNILRETQYRVFVQASGCPDVYSTTLTMLVYEPSVAGTLAEDATVCDSVHSGTLILTGSLGSSIVWQSVDTGAVNDSIQLGGTTYDYSNLTNSTRYIAIVTNGVCPPDSSNVVGVLTNFTIADFAFDNVCIGDEMFFNDASFVKDGFAVQRNWDFGNGTGSTIEDPVVLFDNVGTYEVQLSILSQGLCTDTIIQTVEVYPLPDSTITNLGDSAFCDGDSTILRGEDGLSYLWTTGDSTQFLTVTVEDFYGLTVTDSNLCVNSSEVFIEVWPLPEAEAGNDTTISLGQTTILNGSGGEEYMWDPPTFLDDFMLQNPLSSPDSSIQYTVLVTDSNGCQNTDSVLITVLIDYLFTPSNLVTPNGDGFNDTWFVENLVDYPACEVLIFNEFGEIVFQEREYDNDWAGDFQGSRLPDGTYYYVITCPDAAALYKGHVTILSQQ